MVLRMETRFLWVQMVRRLRAPIAASVESKPETEKPPESTGKIYGLATAAVVMLGLAVFAQFNSQAIAAAINAIVSAVAPSLKAAAGPAKALTNAVRPMMGTLKGIQKTLSILKKGMLPIKYLGKKIQSLMNQQICVGYIVPGKKKVCTKKKILGKKRKICTWKPTKETKKFCSKVGKVIGRVNKLAKVIQKPMDTAIKKLTDPIVKPILKRLPGFTASKLLSQVKKISGSLGVLAKMGALSKKYSPGKLKAYTLRYKALERELLKLNR